MYDPSPSVTTKRGGPVKEQYVGDISDYRKYALLRQLAWAGLRVGVWWMLTPPDGRSDGRKIEYLSQPRRFQHFDPELFEILRSAASEPNLRRLHSIESAGTIPDAIFWNEIVPDPRVDRERQFASALDGLAPADLIFFDPDNGIEPAFKPKGRKDSSKFVYLDELKAMYRGQHSLLVYQHFIREERAGFLRRTANRLQEIAPGASVWAIETAHVAFLLVGQPQHDQRLAKAVSEVELRLHSDMFRSSTLLHSGSAP